MIKPASQHFEKKSATPKKTGTYLFNCWHTRITCRQRNTNTSPYRIASRRHPYRPPLISATTIVPSASINESLPQAMQNLSKHHILTLRTVTNSHIRWSQAKKELEKDDCVQKRQSISLQVMSLAKISLRAQTNVP